MNILGPNFEQLKNKLINPSTQLRVQNYSVFNFISIIS